MRILVVGAGFSGAVYARTLAEHGQDVTVIDRRDHVAGNAHDAVDANGVRVHSYGPHLFHTNKADVVAWLRKFGDLIPYEHSVAVRCGDKYLPLPISRGTFEAYYEKRFDSDTTLQCFLETIVERHEKPRNAREFLCSKIGLELTNLLFQPYTQKMWGLSLENLSADVVKRIAILPGYEHRYFPNDTYQVLPKFGYTRLFENIFDHHRIKVELSTDFEHGLLREFRHTFSSAPIDEHYDYCFGDLPYRSIKFHHRNESGDVKQPKPVVNFSDDGPFTRRTYWHMFPHHHVVDTGIVTSTVEEPCDFRENFRERYYPVNDAAGTSATLYKLYKDLADDEDNITFIGRCGTYRYLDMHQVINQSLVGAHRWLADHGVSSGAASLAGARFRR